MSITFCYIDQSGAEAQLSLVWILTITLHYRVMEQLREGQKAYNLFYKYYPAWANAIRGTECDPFYSDANLPAFYQEVGRLIINRLATKDEIITDFE